MNISKLLVASKISWCWPSWRKWNSPHKNEATVFPSTPFPAPSFLCSSPHLSLPLSVSVFYIPCLCIFSKLLSLALTGFYFFFFTCPLHSLVSIQKWAWEYLSELQFCPDLFSADPSALTRCSFNLGVHGLDASYFLDDFANNVNSKGN